MVCAHTLGQVIIRVTDQREDNERLPANHQILRSGTTFQVVRLSG